MSNKTNSYSLERCVKFLNDISCNTDYSKNEGILTSCFNYLKEYEKKLKKEQPTLFWVKYIQDKDGLFAYSFITNGCIYEVKEETDTEYVILDNYNEVSSFEKDNFIRI